MGRPKKWIGSRYSLRVENNLYGAWRAESTDVRKFDEMNHWGFVTHPVQRGLAKMAGCSIVELKGTKKNRSVPSGKRVPIIFKRCLICTKQFLIRLKEDGRKYCSRKCTGISKQKPAKKCIRCGKDCKKGHRTKFCSIKCSNPRKWKSDKDKMRIFRETLHDSYVKKLLRNDGHRGHSDLSYADFPPELVELKRKQLELKRLLKERS